MSRYIDVDILKNKTTRVNRIWNSTTNAEGKGLDEIIDDIPTADVRENVRAHWLHEPYHNGSVIHRCSNCLETSGIGYTDYWFDFCPNCGADMRGEA